MANFWNENHSTPGQHTLIDLGYLKCRDSFDRLDRLRAAGIGKANVQVVAYGRLLIRIPPTKVSRIMSRFRGIRVITDKHASVYCDCTHVWATPRSMQLRYHS